MYNNQIFVGDTLETLRTFPDDFFDITVTSPPYNKQGMSGRLVSKVAYKDLTDTKKEIEYQDQQIEVLNEVFRVTKPQGHIFYNHKLRWFEGVMLHPMYWLVKTKWNIRQEIIWDRSIAANIRGWRFWQIEERVYWMQKGLVIGDELESKHAKLSSIWKIRPEGRFPDHPAPFPIQLPTRCIYSIADDKKGLNVLDPYCGIGTTLVAANVLQHNYVGIECTQSYVDIANERLNDPNEMVAVAAETQLHVVNKSYKERKKLKLLKTC